MSHHYMEDSGPSPRAKRILNVDERVAAARKAAQSSTLGNLVRTLSGVISCLNSQRDSSTYEDVYIAALAYCQEYEATHE